MNQKLKAIFLTVAMESVNVVRKWQLIDSTSYVNATKGMFEEVFSGWDELIENGSYGLNKDSVLTIRESLNGNNPVYILIREDQMHETRTSEKK